MKKLLLVAAMGLGVLGGANANAATATGNFNVVVNLTPVCQVATAPGSVTFNYTSFGAVQTPSTTIGVQCTNLLPYALSLDGTGSGGTTTALGLNYTLTLSGTTGLVADGTNQSYTIQGNMAAGQTGTCATPAGCTSTVGRVVTITY